MNLDPSHFFWQGIDPVAVIAELGDAVGFAHGKDTTIHQDRVRLHGLLDPRYPVDAEHRRLALLGGRPRARARDLDGRSSPRCGPPATTG